MDTEEIIRELNRRYGETQGTRVFRTIMPGILADFQKMLRRAKPGAPVTEEYRLEDGKGVVVLTGQRNADGTMTVKGRVV